MAIAAALCAACGSELRPGLGPREDAFADAGAGEPDDLTQLQWPDDDPLPEAFDFPPWLTMPEPGRIVVGWRTAEPSTGWVRLTHGNDQWVYVSGDRAELHHVDLGNLVPSSIYRYEVFVDGANARREGVFVTPGADTLRAIHVAEFHAPTDSAHVARFATAIREFQPHLLIESGDMADSGSNFDHWRDYMRTSAPWISNVIFLPAHSNHVNGFEGNSNLLDLFALPNNGRWYTTRFGPVEVVTLDSTFDRDNPDVPFEQVAWLAQVAAAAHDGVDDPAFLFGTWHYPACSSHYFSRSSWRTWVFSNFIQTFVDHGGIDVVLVGHDKYYERSLIDDRIVHLMTNAGKLAPSSPGNNHPRCKPLRTNTVTRSLALIEVTGSEMTASVLDEAGRMIDHFSIDKAPLGGDPAR